MAKKGPKKATKKATKKGTRKSKRQKPKHDTCDVCGGELKGPSHGAGESLWSCQQCGAEFDYYYRLDGKPFSVPERWGRCVAVMFTPEGLKEVEPDEDFQEQVGDIFYVFQDDGTIRRAQMASLPFGEKYAKPENVPDRVKLFHFFVVDVWPSKKPAWPKCD